MTNLQKYMDLQRGLSAEEIRSMDNYLIGALSVYVPQDVWLKCAAMASEALAEKSYSGGSCPRCNDHHCHNDECLKKSQQASK